MAHNHFASTDIDPQCNTCQLAQAMRPLDTIDYSGAVAKVLEHKATKLELIAAAQRMRAEGSSLYEIATTLGVTKEWLREYAI